MESEFTLLLYLTGQGDGQQPPLRVRTHAGKDDALGGGGEFLFVGEPAESPHTGSRRSLSTRGSVDQKREVCSFSAFLWPCAELPRCDRGARRGSCVGVGGGRRRWRPRRACSSCTGRATTTCTRACASSRGSNGCCAPMCSTLRRGGEGGRVGAGRGKGRGRGGQEASRPRSGSSPERLVNREAVVILLTSLCLAEL
jgi:hypothetical protein